MIKLPDLSSIKPSFNKNENLKNYRNIFEGYQRGWGIQFGNLKEQILSQDDYKNALDICQNLTIVSEENRMNLYLINKCFFNSELLKNGDIAEFGSYKGGNSIFLALLNKSINPNRKIFALDTFEGMPETSELDLHKKGDFSDSNLDELLKIKKDYKLDNLIILKGLFNDTSTELLNQTNGISLSYIDCDIYQSCKDAYEISCNKLIDGGYIVFDDATVSSCIGATEFVENNLIKKKNLNSEQIWPHYVFRHHSLS